MVDEDYGKVGICEDVLDQTAQPIFKIADGDTEILIPAVDEFIVSIDRDKKIIHITTPEGLIDLYRNAE